MPKPGTGTTEHGCWERGRLHEPHWLMPVIVGGNRDRSLTALATEESDHDFHGGLRRPTK